MTGFKAKVLLLDGRAEPWRDQGLCAQVDPELWFPEKGGTPEPAKRICAACPVLTECREYALVNVELYGVWGGLSDKERRRMRRQKTAAAVSDLGEAA
jgi:WhiB family transcriptional regulator, redox-sensing transcriptional regulator